MMSGFDTERPLKNRKYEIAQRDRELCAGDRECSQDEEMFKIEGRGIQKIDLVVQLYRIFGLKEKVFEVNET